MLAAAWRLAGAMLMDVKQMARDNTALKAALRRDDKFRAEYLVLYDLVNTIVDVNQKKFALLATTARTSLLQLFAQNTYRHQLAHWKRYFKTNNYKQPGDDLPEFVFDWTFLKDVHKSFLDSIVVELGLPNSPIPKQILLSILNEAIDETPRDAKQFPQALWDAMGDLAVRTTQQRI